MSSMGTHISSFVISMDGQVASNTLLHFVGLVTKHMGVVSCPIKLTVAFNEFPFLVSVAIDDSSQLWELVEQGHAIIVVVRPIIGFLHTLIILFEELTLSLNIEDGHREHCHRVSVLRNGGDEANVFGSDIAVTAQLALQIFELLFVGEFACQQQIDHAFGKRLMPTDSLLAVLLNLGNGVPSESDTRLGIKLRSLIVDSWDLPHAGNGLVQLDLCDDLVAMVLLDLVEL